MNRYHTLLLLVTSAFWISCSKSSNSENGPKTNSTIKIQLVSGDGQTDTVGNPLPNAIVVKVTVNGVPTAGYTVQFQSSGCDEDNIITTPSGPDGTTQYNWSLQGAGQQSMKAYVLNSGNQKADSVSLSATGLQPGPGWHNSACSMEVSSPTALCKLSSGRLFVCYAGEKTYLRFSDDNGVSWNAVKSLGNTHTVTWVLSTPSDEVFAFTEGTDGTFYSNDAGQTWTNLGVPPFNTLIFSSIICTPSGKLIYASAANPPYCISTDKGKTWAVVPFTSFIPQNTTNPTYIDPAEDKDGNLYIVESANHNLFKSSDLGNTWTLVPYIPTAGPGTDIGFYVDQNNWFYRTINIMGRGIYVSKDKGATYNLIIPIIGNNMSLQSDGNFYFEDGSNLYQYNMTSNISKSLFGFYESDGHQSYIVAKNNNLVLVNPGKPYIEYYSQ